VAVAHLQTAGAMVASGLGCIAILLPLLVALKREGISLRPAWNSEYLRAAARFGSAVQLANLLVQMTGRLDLILVYRIAGSAAAGRYSVALTLGTLVGSIPMAIAFTSFPRLPKLPEAEARLLIASLFRVGVAASIMTSLVLAVASPFLIPLMFGAAYSDAVFPSLLLFPAGILWSGQWILCRANASRGAPRSLFVSFSLSFLIMIVLDLVLIESFGINGAATASFISSAAGFAVAVGYRIRAGGGWRPLVPRLGDAARLVTTVREMVQAARNRGTRPSSAGARSAPPV
jgi:O-antigen/teichoic acid export membrane protein